MAISKIVIKDFLVFKGEFTAEFCPGVNVITGGNGTGKTTLLRAVSIRPILGFPYTPFDNTSFENTPNLRDAEHVKVEPFEDEKYDKNKHIFIPVNEMLSHPELYPMARQYRLSFNNSEIDIIGNASLPVTNEITPNAEKILDIIKSIIGGEVIFENDTFWSVKNDGAKIPFALEASGYQKFGLLWKLLRNGLLESESVCFGTNPKIA